MLLVAINAKYIHSNLAVYALKAYAEAQGMKIDLKEYTINHDADGILEDIYLKKPKVIAFSCYLWNIGYVNELISELHRLLPDTDIWVGGPEVSYDAAEYLREHPEVKGVMVGEGELTFLDVCKYYQKELEIFEIKGIVYRTIVGKIISAKDRECMNLDDLPFPYPNLEEFKNRILYYESSRGCPFSCSYCLSSVDRHLRFKSLPKVFKELQYFIDAKVPQVKFVDRTYNAKVEHALAIWEYIKEHDNGITNFHFEVAADILKEEELQCLQGMRPGLVQLEIGVQSTNPQTIEEIHRVMDVGKVAEVTKRLKENENMNLHLDLIAGLPYEDYKTFQRSFDDLHIMRPHQLQLGFLKVLKGSLMYERAGQYEILYHKRPPYEVLRTRWIQFEEIIALKEVEQMVETYYNSGQYSTLLGLCFCLRKEKFGTENAFAFYRGLADYYKENQILTMQHARMKKYEILLSYILEQRENPDSEYRVYEAEVFEEAALYDMYLRENLKSRPGFGKAMDKVGRECKKKYGAKHHMEKFDYDFTEGKFYFFGEKPTKGQITVMFDYEKKNLITGNVFATRVCDDEEGENA